MIPTLRPALILALAAGANADVLLWNNGSGGLASTAANWNPAQVPDALDDAVFDLGTTYTVTWNASVPATRSMRFDAGIVRFNMQALHTTGSIRVGNDAGDVAEWRIVAGQVGTAGGLQVGVGSGSSGEVSVDGQTAILQLTGAGDDLTVGRAGAGLLSLTLGGQAYVADRLNVASNALGSGAIVIRDTSSLTASGTGHGLGINGNATVQVLDLGLLSLAGDAFVGQAAPSVAFIDIDGNGTMSVDGELAVGCNETASAGGSGLVRGGTGFLFIGGDLRIGNDPDGGTGTVEATPGWEGSVNGLTTVGGAVGASGTLRINQSGQFRTGSLAIEPTGILEFNGGLLTIDGGTMSVNTAAGNLVISGSTFNDSPELDLENGALLTLGNTFSLGVFEARSGRLSMRSGARAVVEPGGFSMGIQPASFGLASLADAGTELVARGAKIGDEGLAILELTAGASADFSPDHTYVALEPGSHGDLVVTGAGSLLTCGGMLFVGGGEDGAGGNGTVLVQDGAIADIAISLVVHPSGLAIIDGGLIECTDAEADGTLEIRGGGSLIASDEVRIDSQAVIEGGSIIAPSIIVRNGEMEVHGEALGEVLIASAFASIRASVQATLGNPDSSDGVVGFGLLDANSADVTLLDSNPASLKEATLAGGILRAPNGILVEEGGSLTGEGTIDADVTNLNLIGATGDGLTFTGLVTTTPTDSITGTIVRFEGPDAGLVGAGIVDADIFVDQFGTITPTGSLAMGRAGSHVGFRCGGTLLVGPHAVEVRDSNAGYCDGVTVLGGGTIDCSTGFNFGAGGLLRGFGTILTSSVFQNSQVRPGLPEADPTGSIAFAGALEFDDHPDLAGDPIIGIEIAGPAAFDSLAAGGAATISDAVLEVALLGGYEPQPGDQFVVLTAGALSGRFAEVIQTGVTGGGFAVRYGARTVRLVYCPADIDSSGSLSVFDFLAFQTAFSNLDPIADFDGNGQFNVFDFLQFQTAFSNGC